MHVKAALKRCIELYRVGGTREVYRGIRDYLAHDLGRRYQDTRVDNEARWSFIVNHIDERTNSLIDIGCAEGDFCGRAADRGLEVVGYDRNIMRLSNARKRFGPVENIQFERADLDLEAVNLLPKADIVLFLTVHHHWVQAYGWEVSVEMVQLLLEKAGTLIYEPPGHIAIRESTNPGTLDPNESIEYYSRLLKATFGDEIQILDATLTDYKDDSLRRDPIFAIRSPDAERRSRDY